MKKSKENKHIFLIIIAIFFLTGCSPKVVPVPTDSHTEVNVRDSLVVRDSIVVIPVERVVDVAAVYDTLKMETSLAAASAWVDTTNHILRGEIANKKAVQKEIKTEIKWQTRDSIVYKELPVFVEKVVTKHPGYEWVLWVYVLLTLLGLGVYVYLKLVKPKIL